MQDTGVIQGISEAPQTVSFARHGPAAAGARARDPRRIPRWRACRPSSASTAPTSTLNSGRMLINLKPHGAARQRVADVMARLQARAARGRGHHALHAAGAGPHHRGPREPHPVPVHARGRRRGASSRNGRRRLVDAAAQLPQLADVASDLAGRGPAGVRRRSTATPPARLGVTPAAIDNALYNAFGQRLISTIFTQSNQYRVVLEVKPEFQQRPGRARGHLRHLGDVTGTPGGAAQVPLVDDRAPGQRATPALARDQPHRPVPGRDHLLQPRAGRVARRGGAAPSRTAQQEHRHAAPACAPASRARRSRSAPRSRNSCADPRRDRHHVHRAGRALRELHPPGDDPLDAALGRRGRAAGAADRRPRPRRHRASSASSC